MKAVKLRPVNSYIGKSQTTENMYHIIRSYKSYTLNDDNTIRELATAYDKHLLGECKHCKKVKDHFEERWYENENKEKLENE